MYPNEFTQESVVDKTFGDVFVLADDDETYGGILADDEETYGSVFDTLVSLLMSIFKPSKKFYLLQLEFTCTSAGQNFEIERIEFQKVKVKV